LMPAWKYLADNVPADGVIAYTQTYLIYPLYGDEMKRHLLYAPVRAEVTDFLHLPHWPSPTSGEAINGTFTDLLNNLPDQTVWRRRLTNAGAQYLFIFLDGPLKQPPEFLWAQADATHFVPLFQNRGAAIYRIQL
jgi:hypothetical protein